MSVAGRVCLADFITLQRGFDLPQSKRSEGVVPVVASNGISSWHNVAKVKAPGVVIGRSGSIGGGQYIEEDFWPLNTTLYVKDFKGNNPRYVYYVLRSIDFSSFNAGAGVPTLNRNHIAALEVDKQPRDIQDKIIERVEPFENAIANARKQIELLEEAAMRLYREWFVDNAYNGQDVRLFDVIDFNPSEKIKKGVVHPIVSMSALVPNTLVLDTSMFEYGDKSSGSKFRDGDTLLARITPCLENGKTAFVGGIGEDRVASGSTEFIVMRSRQLNPYMVYLIARSEDFRKIAIASMSGADGRQRADVDVISRMKFKLPCRERIEKFGDIVRPVFEKCYKLEELIRSLAEARDRLLPKLMSGEIDVMKGSGK